MSVYIIHAPENGVAKIGFSASPSKRLSKMLTDSPTALHIVVLLDGGPELEAELHSRFSHLRERGEWFRVTDDLEEFILSNPVPPKEKAGRKWHSAPASEMAQKRRALGLSQGQLATLLLVNQATISRNETAADPDRRYVLALEALAGRHEQGEDLAEIARSMAEEEAARAA